MLDRFKKNYLILNSAIDPIIKHTPDPVKRTHQKRLLIGKIEKKRVCTISTTR